MHERIIDWQHVADVTIIHPLALAATLICGLLMIFLPRRFAIVPMIVSAAFIPVLQRIAVFGLDFYMIRILILFGWIRVVVRSEFDSFKLNTIDKLIIPWVIASIVTYTLLWQTSGAFINRLGFAFDAAGMYFLFRVLIRGFDDIETIIRALALVAVPLAICMLIEKATGRNGFSMFGGVPEMTYVREGRLRCQGAFGHPILAGTFGASLVPLFVGLWWRAERRKIMLLIGMISGTIITVTSASSGPAATFVAGIFGLYLWRFRKHMRTIRWAVFLMLLGLHMVMKAPVWALMMRATVVPGSDGYHRFAIFDRFITRFNEWWLLGTKSCAEWGWGLQDRTNQYVVYGVDGGLVTVALFIIIIVLCFRGIGRAIQGIDNNKGRQLLLWGLGASLFSHVVTFMGVSYFDQMKVFWFILLGMISSVTSHTHYPIPTVHQGRPLTDRNHLAC